MIKEEKSENPNIVLRNFFNEVTASGKKKKKKDS